MPFGGLLTAGVLTAGGLAIKGYNYYKAGEDEEAAKKALNELSKTPYSQYSVSTPVQSFYNRVLSRSMNPQGMGAAELAAGKDAINKTQATTLYNVRNQAGGNLSKYISGALQPQYASATANLYGQDARMKREDEARNTSLTGSAAGQIQQIQNLQTQAELDRRMKMEYALGQSVLQNKAFKTQALEGLSSDLTGAGINLFLGGGAGGMGGGYSDGGAGGYKTTTGKPRSGYIQPGNPGYIG